MAAAISGPHFSPVVYLRRSNERRFLTDTTLRVRPASSYPYCMAGACQIAAWPYGGAICRAGLQLADFRCERSISSYFLFQMIIWG